MSTMLFIGEGCYLMLEAASADQIERAKERGYWSDDTALIAGNLFLKQIASMTMTDEARRHIHNVDLTMDEMIRKARAIVSKPPAKPAKPS